MSMSRRFAAALLLMFLFVLLNKLAYGTTGTVRRGAFRFDYGASGISAIGNTADPFGAIVTRRDRPLGVIVRYREPQGNWKEVTVDDFVLQVPERKNVLVYKSRDEHRAIAIAQTFTTDGTTLDWTIDISSRSSELIEIGDLAVSIPETRPDGEEPRQIFERSFLRHQFIGGSGSFLYFVRPAGTAPFLAVTVHPGTKLEYSQRDRTGTVHYIHSAKTGAAETRGTWRQAHTALTLSPKGSTGSSVKYGFRFRWANTYDELRSILYDEGLFDFRGVPGMTVPEDLKARFALHTKAQIEAITPEFPDATTITPLGEARPGVRLYEVSFRRLGENKLTIRHDGGRETYLEYFVTEPIETLIKKRSAFLVERQQVRDASKWWDGVFAPYDMRAGKVRTFDDPDIFTGRMVYVLTCDDPGLSKAPLLAAKNVAYPVRREIEAIEYYLEHFVWGKLQRTGEETPYPYGVYGTPDWFTNRDPQRRAKVTKSNLDKMHVWRSYDYPHVVMLYFHMYEIAKKYPAMSTYLDAAGYLDRAYNTAQAFFQYSYEIMPDYYETYKWGLYNELVVLNLADALEREGAPDKAAWLRSEWEKKVKYFVYDDLYPFRSEYAFDRTAFESSYAFAKFGATHDMLPDQNLWWDIQHKKWYSHPSVKRADSRDFMERQLAAGLTVRGWLEPTYHQLGADPGLSYMAAMGGWGILDYGLNFAAQPHDWLQLGYASYLSSWALMNTGRKETGYGYWYPGAANDGAAGWQYMGEKFGHAWMGDTVPRGAWRYDGEIDLGFGGALRMASTIVAHDPLFGWTAYGGDLSNQAEKISVVPRDGLRQRFAFVTDTPAAEAHSRTLRIELDRDGFAANTPLIVDRAATSLVFTLENRTNDAHTTGLRMSFPAGRNYRVLQSGKPVALAARKDWEYPWEATLNVSTAPTTIEIVLVQER